MSPHRGEYAVALSGVTKRFDRRVAVDRLSFRVRRGTTLGLVGVNGAGKTTALRLIVGLLAPDEGTVEIDGVSDGTVASTAYTSGSSSTLPGQSSK